MGKLASGRGSGGGNRSPTRLSICLVSRMSTLGSGEQGKTQGGNKGKKEGDCLFFFVDLGFGYEQGKQKKKEEWGLLHLFWIIVIALMIKNYHATKMDHRTYHNQDIYGLQPVKAHKPEQSKVPNPQSVSKGNKKQRWPGNHLQQMSSRQSANPSFLKASTFLKKYQILPAQQSMFSVFNRRNCQSTPGLLTVSYRKINNEVEKQDRKVKVEGGLEVGKFNNYTKSDKSSLIQRSISLQRELREVSMQTKITKQSNSTRLASHAIPYSLKSKPCREQQISKNKMMQYGLAKPSVILKSEIQQIDSIGKPIPEEYQSSQSKTYKNQSSLHKNSVDNSKKSIKNLSMSLSRSIKSFKSIQSLKSSIKNSLYLPVNSLVGKSVRSSGNPEETCHLDELEGLLLIENYLEVLSVLANYASQITDNYENSEDWEQLIFLTYKKYYLYRVKFFNALMFRNTLFFQKPSQKLSMEARKSLKKFMNSESGQLLRQQIFKENIHIGNSLRNIYNIAIEKSGNYINLLEVDNFSSEIFRLMCDEIEQLKENYYSEPQLVKVRVKSIIKSMIAITRLDKNVDAYDHLNELAEEVIKMDFFNKLESYVREYLL